MPADRGPTTGLRGLRVRLGLYDRLARAARFSPARLAVVIFAAIIGAVAALLALPISTASGRAASLVDSLFTATSAVCVT